VPKDQPACKIDLSKLPRGVRKAVRACPVQRLTDLIFSEATRLGADQIRISAASEETVGVEFRIHDEWCKVESPPRRLLEALVAQVTMAWIWGPEAIPLVQHGKATSAELQITDINMTLSLPSVRPREDD